MKANELMVEQWFKREDYKMDDVSQFICNNLLSIYKNPIVCIAILSEAISTFEKMDIDGEIWKEMPDYEGLYQISNRGRIKSVSRIKNAGSKFKYVSKEKLLKQQITKDGYLSVFLCKNGERKCLSVHRLVAIAFIPNDGKLSDVNHKDENKLNNSVDNLEWCSKEYNTKYGTRTQRTSKRIKQVSLDGEYLKTYNSVKEASRMTGIGSSNIHNCAIGKVLIKRGKEYTCRSAGGYLWEYE